MGLVVSSAIAAGPAVLGIYFDTLIFCLNIFLSTVLAISLAIFLSLYLFLPSIIISFSLLLSVVIGPGVLGILCAQEVVTNFM